MQSNVLLIVLDTARADAFEPYGAAAGSSPAFADLAGRGAAVSSAYSAASWTVPSHASMLTGLLPRATGLGQAPQGRPHGCKPALEARRERLLAEVLRGAGYSTAAVSTNLWLTPESGFATGFERFATIDTRRQADLTRTTLTSRGRWVAEGVRARVDDGAAEAAATLEGWIGERPQAPFFWFVNLVECHSPYLPPKPFNELGPLDRARAAVEARRHLTMDAIWRACAGGFDVPEEALERMRSLYAAAVRALDAWLERLLGSLDDAGLLDDTLVIVTSDHGENFGEGGLMGHAYSLDDRLIRVPMALAGPGAPELDGAFSLAALPALIAEAIGLDEHPWHEVAASDGVAVAEFDPPSDDPEHPRVLDGVRSWGLGPDAVERITTPLSCATDGRLKLLRRGAREELYDLAADPLEREPIAADGGGPELAALRRALDRAAGATPPAPAPAAAISDDEREQLEERMRLLGYL